MPRAYLTTLTRLRIQAKSIASFFKRCDPWERTGEVFDGREKRSDAWATGE